MRASTRRTDWQVIATARNEAKSRTLAEVAKAKKNMSEKALHVASEESTKQLAWELKGVPIDVLVLNSAIYTRNGNALGELNYGDGARASRRMCWERCGWRKRWWRMLRRVKKQIVAISSGRGSVGDLGRTMSAGPAYQYRTTKTALNTAMAILPNGVKPRE